MAEGVVVALEAVEVEDDQHERVGRRGSVQARIEVGGQLAPVAEFGERVRDPLFAQEIVRDDVRGGPPRALHEPVHDGFLVLTEGSLGPCHRQRALRWTRVAVEAEGQRQRPHAIALELAGACADLGSGARGGQRLLQPRAVADLDRALLDGAAELQASAVGVERLDRAAQHDVGEGLHVELGGERVAEPPHRGLQTAALARDEVEASLRRLDARAAVAREEQQHGVEGKQQQHLGGVVTSRVRDQQSERGDAGVDRPHEAHHADLHARADAEDRGLAHGRGDEVDQPAGEEGGDVDERLRRAAVPGLREQQDQRWAQRVPCVGDREQHPLDAHAPRGDLAERAEHDPRRLSTGARSQAAAAAAWGRAPDTRARHIRRRSGT